MEAAVNEVPQRQLERVSPPDEQPSGFGCSVEIATADAKLLALAPELEATATLYLAYDLDLGVAPDHPAHVEAVATKRQLLAKVQDVAERIFQHQPETLAGVLLTAHAAAVTAETGWEDVENVGADGLLLRLLANSLFRLAGVDWRGRPLAGAPATHDGCDAGLTALVADLGRLDAEIVALGAAHPGTDLEEIPDVREREGRRDAVLRDLCRLPAEGTRGLVAKAQALRSRSLMDDGVRHGDLAMSLAHDVERLAAPSFQADTPPTEAADDAGLIPLAEAAIAEERAATAVSEATDHDTPPGAFARSMQLLELVTATEARTPAGVAAKARVLLTHATLEDDLDGDFRCEALALSLARDATRLDASRPLNVAQLAPAPDPIFEAIDTYRSAHAILVGSLAEPGEADEELIERSDLAFEALLAARPTTEAGRLAHLQQIVFEFAYTGRGCSPSPEWIADAGRLVNGGLPVLERSLSPLAIEPVAADQELHDAIEAHFLAYAHRLHSEVYEQPDAAATVDRELAAFRKLLHSRLGTDAGRVAYATAVLGRAVGAHPDELHGDGRTAPLAVAYRNLAHGQFWREDENMRPIAAE